MLLGGIEIKQIDILAEEALEKIYKRIERYTQRIGRASSAKKLGKTSIYDSPFSFYRHMPIAEFSSGFVYLQKMLPKSLTFKELPI